MKNLLNAFMMLGIFAASIVSCTEESSLIEEPKMNIETKSSTRSNASNRQVIVLAAPSVHNNYYRQIFQDIVDFQVDFANEIDGRDEVIILVDAATRRYYEGRVPSYVLVHANIEDIWIRDFSPAIAGKQVKFNYLPDYLNKGDANFIDNSFETWHSSVGLEYGRKSRLILDGGNVVDNGKGKVIVTDRFLYDNPRLTRRQAKRKLKNLLGATHVAIIRETPGDATGHSDGMVMWTDDNTILLHDQPPSVKTKIIRELRRSFPGVKIVIVPDYYIYEEWQGFSSACNIYVNSVVSNNYIYLPTFNGAHDQEMLDFVQANSSKTVVGIPAEKVCIMGGSVRCLTWQLDGQFASDILEE